MCGGTGLIPTGPCEICSGQSVTETFVSQVLRFSQCFDTTLIGRTSGCCLGTLKNAVSDNGER